MHARKDCMDIKKLQDELDNRGISHRQFAIKCGLTEPHASRIFRKSIKTISVGTCQKIVKGLELDPQTAYYIFFE